MNSRMNNAEKRISDLEDRIMEINKNSRQKVKKKKRKQYKISME